MVTRLHVNNEDLVDRDESELHLMPCKIHGDQAAKVSSYFKPYMREIDEECEWLWVEGDLDIAYFVTDDIESE